MVNFKLKISLISAFFLLIIAVAVPEPVLGQPILFQDDFESGTLNNWQTIHGSWNITSDSLYPENGNWLRGNAPSGTDNEIQGGDFNWHDYEFSFDILPKVGVDRNIFFRVNNVRTNILPGHDLPVSYSLQPTGGLTYLGKWTTSGFGGLPGSPASIPTNVKSNLIIKVEGQNIKVSLNGSQILDYNDITNPILGGRIALGVITGSDPSEVLYDNVLVTELTPSPTPSPSPTATPTPTALPSPTPSPTLSPTPVLLSNLNVSDIKQYSSPWGNHVYDSANFWSSHPNINRWGCALTSAVMILNYYGRNITPDTLNNWLKAQPDGYLGNGLVNWLAVSRYSKLTSNALTPALEYLRLPSTLPVLINELNSGRPAILEEPGHFIVGKGQTTDSFKINDPGYSNRPTLASYGNSFKSLGSYIPSHTDLSYIMLTIDPDVNLLVKDSSGDMVSGVYFIQDPMIDDINNTSLNGQALGVFMYPKPEDGDYQIDLSGNPSTYKLNTYVYDENGNVDTRVINGKITKNKKDKILLKVKDNNKGHKNQRAPFWFKFWWRLFNHL